MIILFPLSHEQTTVRRMPVITLSLIIVNVLLFIITAVKAPETTEKLVEKKSILIHYYYDHPYLDIPDETRKKLFSEHPDLLKEINDRTVETPKGYNLSMEQKMIDKAVGNFEEAYENEFYRKYGYIPARGGVEKLLYSMFLHSGFFHLLFNMLFLFLSGYILEDYWGRGLYLLFYLTGGVAATLTHAHMFPDSFVPLVGASGAIAALMGAFFIRLFKTRIHFFYFVLIVIRFWYGRFLAPAYIMLPLWLAAQLFFALLDNGSGAGVAFWAHIGGFVYGCVFALVMKLLKIEERLITHAIEQKVTVYDAEKDPLMTDAVKHPGHLEENGLKHRERALFFLSEGDMEKALFECRRALVIHIKKHEATEAMDFYMDMCEDFPRLSLKHDYQKRLVDLFEKHGRFKDAALACKNLVHDLKDSGLKEELAAALKRYDCLLRDHLNQAGPAEKVFEQVRLPEKTGVKQPVVSALGRETQDSVKEGHENEHPMKSEGEKSNAGKLKICRNNKVTSIDHLPSQPLLSVDPRMVARTSLCPEGLVLEGVSQKPLPCQSIRFITVFQFFGESHFCLDLFVKGEMRPYRIKSDRVAFADFFDKTLGNAAENFRRFIGHLLSVSPALLTDLDTRLFMDKGKVRIYTSDTRLEAYEKSIWSRLKDR